MMKLEEVRATKTRTLNAIDPSITEEGRLQYMIIFYTNIAKK